MQDSGSIIAILMVSIIVLFGIFMLMRELMCWYWKINELIGIQKEIRGYLKVLAKGLPAKTDIITEQSENISNNASSSVNATPEKTVSAEELMEQYGIKFSSFKFKFVYKDKSFDELKDAVAYAKEH